MTLTLVIDTGPLSHFAQTGNITVLESLSTMGFELRYPEAVSSELRQKEELNKAAIDSSVIVCSDSIPSVDEDAYRLRDKEFRRKAKLGVQRRMSENLGEASCIAYARYLMSCGHTCVYIDDGEGRRVARDKNLVCLTTLDLLACLTRMGMIDSASADRVFDELKDPKDRGLEGYSLPFENSQQFREAFCLDDGLGPVQADEDCFSCLEANDIDESAPLHHRRSLCHLCQGWLPRTSPDD